MGAKKIERLLTNALLKGGDMVYELYAFELEENLDFWATSMARDEDDFILTVDEHDGDVAMALLHKTDGLYVNEDAREKLKELWGGQYENNIRKMIPYWAAELSVGSLPLNGVKFQ